MQAIHIMWRNSNIAGSITQSKCNFFKNYNQINTNGWYNFSQTFYFAKVYIILRIFMQRPQIYTFKCLRSYVIYDRYDELQLGRAESIISTFCMYKFFVFIFLVTILLKAENSTKLQRFFVLRWARSHLQNISAVVLLTKSTRTAIIIHKVSLFLFARL